MRAPPPTKPIHRERTTTPTAPLETTIESSATPMGTGPTATIGGGDSARPFTLKNLEAPGKFFGLKHPAGTTWLTEMSHWIRLNKALEDDLWDVVATRMTGGAFM